MPRFRVPLFALALLIAMTTAIPSPGGAQGATPAASPTTKPQPPTQPATGPGSSEPLFGGITTIEQTSADEIEADYWLFVPSDPLPEGAAATETLPLVIFGHSYTVRDPDPYLGWIEHLVRRGAIVLYPEYEEDATDFAGYRQNFLDDMRSALDTLQRERVAVDLQRVAVTGHSLGGALAADYAASAAAASLPVPAAVMSVAPGCPPEVECLIADLAAIPATTRVLLVVEADDSDPMGGGAVERIWSGVHTVPLENRDIVTLVSDTHGVPWLLATHDQPKAANPGDATYAADAPNALDWYGTWKWFDALMSCAFAREWCEVALGNTPEQRFMGIWSDGVSVTEAVVTDDPA